jgi:hypothetical protein
MTQDEIIEMARKAGIIAVHTEGDGHWYQQFVALEAFAKLVAAKEREACAKLCEEEKLNATHYLATTQSNWLAIKIRTK